MSTSFFGFLEALRQYNMVKVLAEPNLVTMSGRPASFSSGGEFPILVPQALGTVSVEYREFGIKFPRSHSKTALPTFRFPLRS